MFKDFQGLSRCMRTPTATFSVNTDNDEAMENVHIKRVEFKKMQGLSLDPQGHSNVLNSYCSRLNSTEQYKRVSFTACLLTSMYSTYLKPESQFNISPPNF